MRYEVYFRDGGYSLENETALAPHVSEPGGADWEGAAMAAGDRIPASLARMLAFALTEAEDLACAGEVGQGERCLLEGLQAAQAALARGEEWGDEWAQQWERALSEFRDRWTADGSV